jgi:serine protease Do
LSWQTGDYAQQAIQRLAREAGPSVVGVLGRARGGSGRGGSGVVVGEDRVLTLARNLGRDGVSVSFANGRKERGHVLGVDHDTGVALLDVPGAGTSAVAFAEDSQPPAIGTPVYALADPGGRGLRVTAGAVASAARSLRGPRGRLLAGLIEHTAPLPRGSGGGPLLAGDGRLLGINALRVDEGFLLALPATTLRARLEDLQAGRTRPRRRLGVAIVPPRAARRLRGAVGLPERAGVLVRAVLPGSPAERAGVQRGDLIVAAQRAAVESVDALLSAVDAAPPDRPFLLTVVRGVQERDIAVSFQAPEGQ